MAAPAPRRWMWFGLAVEASKPIVGLSAGLFAFTEALHSMVVGIHADITAHYNHKLQAQRLHEQVTLDLEMLQTED